MTEENESKVQTKQDFRERMWVYMAKEEITNSHRSLCNRIPFFKGSSEATKRLAEMDEFKNAKLLMISPKKTQESLILLSLQQQKEILIPRPRLLTGLFYNVKNTNGLPEDEIKNSITRHNIKQMETPVGFETKNLKVDLIVVGSVCVNKSGCRIGTGEGFSDLEYAILSKMNAVDENTKIVTTVHDCQILDDLPNDLFEPHDVPVDIIITPTQTIVAAPQMEKQKNIIWSAISNRRLKAIPVLNEIKEFEEKEGRTLELKEVDSDVECVTQEKMRITKMINKLHPRTRRKRTASDNILKENQKSKEVRRKPSVKKRSKLSKVKNGNDENDENIEKAPSDAAEIAAPKKRQRSGISRKSHVDFSLRLSNIASTVRIRDLKVALLERGVKPSNITWRGQRGFCFLHFGKLRKSQNPEPIQVDSIVANLQQLKIGEPEGNTTPENHFIVVEPAEPVTRIEVTDVSAV